MSANQLVNLTDTMGSGSIDTAVQSSNGYLGYIIYFVFGYAILWYVYNFLSKFLSKFFYLETKVYVDGWRYTYIRRKKR